MKKLLLCGLLLSTNIFGQVKKISYINKTSYVGMKVKVSAYCLKGSKTAMGKIPVEGIVAGDPRYYKLGSYIRLNGRKFLVADTGGNIKGINRFDIYIYSCSQAKKFGIQSMFLTF